MFETCDIAVTNCTEIAASLHLRFLSRAIATKHRHAVRAEPMGGFFFFFWPCRNPAVVWISQDSVATGLNTTKPSALELSFAPSQVPLSKMKLAWPDILIRVTNGIVQFSYQCFHSYFTRISVFRFVTGKVPAKTAAHRTSSVDNFVWTLVLSSVRVCTYWCMSTVRMQVSGNLSNKNVPQLCRAHKTFTGNPK